MLQKGTDKLVKNVTQTYHINIKEIILVSQGNTFFWDLNWYRGNQQNLWKLSHIFVFFYLLTIKA